MTTKNQDKVRKSSKFNNYLSIVLSFRNEEEVLPELIRRLRKVLLAEQIKNAIGGYELIFVNDVSTDRSLEILLSEAHNNKDIKIINMSRNFGVSPCVMAGMQYAKGDVLVYMDTDLQDPPELIPEMLRARNEQKADVVHTKRKSRDGESRVKLLITKLGYFILKKFSSIDIQPETGDFKLLSRRAVNHLIQLKENRPFVRGLINWIGFKQTAIEYNREKRSAGKTKFPVLGKKVISNFFNSALISFSDAPLKLASFMGFLVSAGAFFLLIYIVVQKILGHNLPGWSAIMVTMLFLGGLNLLAIGILGLYVNSIFIETKKRPNFIVESTFGFDNDEKHEKRLS
ncbi:MAG: glycosyltransferase family 2 protein [Patescibacteria group bacterium]